jgi:hypothetical protein
MRVLLGGGLVVEVGLGLKLRSSWRFRARCDSLGETFCLAPISRVVVSSTELPKYG